jgi:hypothetical protein
MKKGFCDIIKNAVLLGLLVWAIMSCGTDTPLAEYTPSSDQEAAVKNVLLGFEDGVNRRDVKKVAGLIHEGAMLMLGRERRLISKPDYLKILPQRLELLKRAKRRIARADHHDPFNCRRVRRLRLR